MVFSDDAAKYAIFFDATTGKPWSASHTLLASDDTPTTISVEDILANDIAANNQSISLVDDFGSNGKETF